MKIIRGGVCAGIIFSALALLPNCYAIELPFFTSVSEEPAENGELSRGMYETIAGYLRVKDVYVPGTRELRLNVPSFSDALPVSAVIQDHPAPLVVMMPGIAGRRDAAFTKLWPAVYAKAGYNVLWFDSTFLPSFIRSSNHGPSGHLWIESEQTAKVIEAFLQREDLKVTQIGVVGMSYGGLQALVLGKLSRAGKLPFKIAAVQAYSPPADIQETAAILDEMYDNHRHKYTLIELNWEVGRHKPVDCAVGNPPLKDSLMQAALAAAFHEELVPVTLFNDCHFNLRHINGRTPQERRDIADGWGFQNFAYDMSLPYWERHSKPAPLEVVAKTRVCELLKGQLPNARVFIAANDPFNRAEDMDELRACPQRDQITILPSGGHVGYADRPETEQRLLSLFDNK
ncbi:MAG TPA: hypothetical protein VEK08_00175 [Planctomycetota bacterium]|nr:hypothetical protein [Planctomycetota bacterium]